MQGSARKGGQDGVQPVSRIPARLGAAGGHLTFGGLAAPPFLLGIAQMRRLSPHFPLSHGKPRVDDRRVRNGIIHVIRHAAEVARCAGRLRPTQDPHDRFIRWSRMGVFDRIFAALAAKGGPNPSSLPSAAAAPARWGAASTPRRWHHGPLAGAAAAAVRLPKRA